MSEITSSADYDTARARLQGAAASYYTDGQLLMSDSEYDSLLARVARYEQTHQVEDTVTDRVASGAAPTGDVAHTAPMLSLDNICTAAELTAWTNRTGNVDLVVEPKLDGLAICVRYQGGVPVQLVTRGDGQHGEDVTYALPTISNLPRPTTQDDLSPFTGEVRGEVIFTRSQFETANRLRDQHGDKPFINARNGAAGALRGTRTRDYVIELSFFAYDLADPQDLLSAYPDHHGWAKRPIFTHTEAIKLLARLGFATATSLINTTDAAVTTVQQYADVTLRDQLPVEVDGTVIKVDAYRDRDRLGTGTRAPRWAVAYKYPSQEVTSVLEDVLWQVGRTGVITPRAVIRPVQVGGTTVTYATLHNPGDTARKGFKIFDHVLVKRAGEVIPRIEAPLVARRDGRQLPIQVPTDCPRCGGALDTSGARWRCLRGRACGLVELLTYAVSRDALDIEGLSGASIRRLVDTGAFTDVASIFTQGSDATVLTGQGGVAGANAPKIVARIEQARTDAGLGRVLTALGISGTGRALSRRIATHFGSMDALRAATVDQLAEVDKVGTVKAAMIRAELDDLADVLDRLSACGVVMDGETTGAPATSSSGALTGMKVVVTGTMTGPLAGASRTDVNELIEAAGGTPSSSVSKSTDLLVAGERAGSKLSKATTLGIRTVDEGTFAKMIGR